MALDKESQNLTAFIMQMGLNKRKRLPMGRALAPGSFQNILELILSGTLKEIELFRCSLTILLSLVDHLRNI